MRYGPWILILNEGRPHTLAFVLCAILFSMIFVDHTRETAQNVKRAI
jgi:hypothetical protein